MPRRRKSKRRKSSFEKIGNWISLVLVLGAVGSAGVVWWRWEYRERRFDQLILASAAKYGVDPCLVKAVMRRESKFDPFVYGSHGEIGLMQVTVGAGEAWARAVGRRGFGGSALWDAGVNVEAGTWYLGRALGRWRGRVPEELGVALAVAEYNAGYGNALRWWGEARRGAGGVGGTGVVGGGGGGEVTVEEFVGGITWPGVRDYVREVMENWRMYRERWGV